MTSKHRAFIKSMQAAQWIVAALVLSFTPFVLHAQAVKAKPRPAATTPPISSDANSSEESNSDNDEGDDTLPPTQPSGPIGSNPYPDSRGGPLIRGGRPVMDGNLADFKALALFIQQEGVNACAVNQLDNFANGPAVGPDGFQDEPLQDDATPQFRFMHSPINAGNFIFIYYPDTDGLIVPADEDDSWLGVGVNIANGDGDVCIDNPGTPTNECLGITKLTSPPDLPANIMVPFDSDGNGDPCVLGTGAASRWAPSNPVLTFDEAVEGITLAFKLCALDPGDLASPEFTAQYLQSQGNPTALSLFGLDPANFELFPPMNSTCESIRLRGLDGDTVYPDGLGNDDIEIIINNIDTQVAALFPGEDYISVTRYRLAQLGMTLRSDSTGDLSNEDSMFTLCSLDIPEIEITKQVRCEGDADDQWRDSADIAPGSVVEFRVEVANAGNVPLSVTLSDTLQELNNANLDIDLSSLEATLFRPADGPGVAINPANAGTFGLSPIFFTAAPAGFLGGIVAGEPRFLGLMNPTEVCLDNDDFVLGDRLVLTFSATSSVGTSFCSQQPVDIDIRNSISATGDPDSPPELDGDEVVDMAGGAPDTPRERLRGGDDNVVTINVLCQNLNLLKEVRLLPNGAFATGDTPLIIPAAGGQVQLQYRYTVQNLGEVAQDITLSDVALCQHAAGVPGITLPDCEICGEPTPGILNALVPIGGTLQSSCSITFNNVDTLRSFLTLDNNQTCHSAPSAGNPNDCYGNCATVEGEIGGTNDICGGGVVTDTSNATICNRVCMLDVTKRVRCILDSCTSPTTFGPFVDSTTDPLQVTPSSCVQYEIEVRNTSTDTPMCRVRLEDILSGSPADITFAAGSAQLDVGGVPCPMPACFNVTGAPCEINPASCPAFTGGVFGPGQIFRVRFRATIPTGANAAMPDPINMITVDGAADCPGGVPAYSCEDTSSVDLDVLSTGLRCDSKQWQFQTDTDADCDADPPFGAFSSSINLTNAVFPVLLNLRMQATNTGQVPLNVTAQDTALNTCVMNVAGVDFVSPPACELGVAKLVAPGAMGTWNCQIRIDSAAAARAMDACDNIIDGTYDNTANVSGVTTANGMNLCVQGTTVASTQSCAAEIVLPQPCDIDVNKQVKCKTDPDSAYAASIDALPGTTETYRLQITNAGPVNVPEICITDALGCNTWFVPNSVNASLNGTNVNNCVAAPFGASLLTGARACYSFGACRPAAPWIAPGETLSITFDVTVPPNFGMVGLETDCSNTAMVQAYSENCSTNPPVNQACSSGSGGAEFNVLIPGIECDNKICVDIDNDNVCDVGPTSMYTLPDTTTFPLTIDYVSMVTNTGESPLSNVRICDPLLVANAAAAGLTFLNCDFCDGVCDGDLQDQCADVAPIAPGGSSTAHCRIQVPTREAWNAFAAIDPDGNGVCYRDDLGGLGSVPSTTGLCTNGANGNVSTDTCSTTLCIPIPDSMGGCCLEDGQCLYVTEEDCAGMGGLYNGDNVQCLGDHDGNGKDDLCDMEIPTVSEWGLVIMTLLLLIVARIYFGQPPATAYAAVPKRKR